MNCLNQISDQYDTSELSDIVDLFYNRELIYKNILYLECLF